MQSFIKVEKQRGLILNILPFIIFSVILLTIILAANRAFESAGLEGAAMLEKALNRASVQCYAIEGRYPPSIQYIKDNYGVYIDERQFNVFYNAYGSNIMPDIDVIYNQEGNI